MFIFNSFAFNFSSMSNKQNAAFGMSRNVHMSTHTHTHASLNMHMCTHTHTHTRARTHTRTRAHACTHRHKADRSVHILQSLYLRNVHKFEVALHQPQKFPSSEVIIKDTSAKERERGPPTKNAMHRPKMKAKEPFLTIRSLVFLFNWVKDSTRIILLHNIFILILPRSDSKKQ